MITDSELEKMNPRELEDLAHRATAIMIDKIYRIKAVQPTNELAKHSF